MLERILKWSVRLTPARVGLIAGLAVMATVLMVFTTLYRTSLNSIKLEVGGDLRRTAQIAASLVDGDLHQKFVDRGQESSADYVKAIEPLAKMVESSNQIAFVYTLVPDRGRARFVLDPTKEGDADGDGVDDKSHIMQLYPDVSEAALKALSQRVSISEEEPSADDWGTFISGFAPFYNSKGDFVGVAGVDLEATDYAGRLAGVQKAGLLALIVGTLLSTCIGLLAGLAQKISLDTRQEILDRQRDLAEAKVSLEEAVHAEQAAKEQMQVASQRFQLLFNELPVSCFTFDSEGRICEWNDLFEELFGVGVEDLFLRPVSDIFGALALPLSTVVRGPALRDYEWVYERPDGTRLTLLTTAFAIELQEEQVGGIGSILDITERKQLEIRLEDQLDIANDLNKLLDRQRQQLEVSNRRLEELSITDGLTGVRNRRSLEEELSRAMQQAERQGTKLSVVLLDVDNFKAFNDGFGHLAGDEVLKAVAAIMKREAREYDVVARYGGEEFCVVLPCTDISDSTIVADRLRQAIANHPWVQRPVTASFGVATWDFRSEQDTLLGFADLALYQSKFAGRNRVSHASVPDSKAA